ncbi:AAA family ATPase [Hydrogenimonas sp.]
MSFREFLELKLGERFPVYTLDEILRNHQTIAKEITKRIKPLEHFGEYRQVGYYPFYFDSKESYCIKLEETINAVIEGDLPIIFNIEPANIRKLKQLAAYICSVKPYELNVTALSQKIGIHRKTLYQYIHYLSLGHIFFALEPKGGSDSIFSKPAKLYLDNPNLYHCYCEESETGSVREIFLIDMLSIAHRLSYPKRGDLLVDDRYLIEIGGRNKSFRQIEDIPDSYVAADDIETGFGHKIPLWLFGFLY